MAVQKSKGTRARRGSRRAHNALRAATLSTDRLSGEMHYRHHISRDGFYCGQKVITTSRDNEEE